MSILDRFVYGTATSSYQIEGAANEGGRDDSIWDTFSKTDGKVFNGDSGEVACDHYHRYKEDVELLEEIGVDAYRFSIAWPRIISEDGSIKEEGIRFYQNLLLELKSKKIKTCATLYHWDLPQWLEDKGGWCYRNICDYFLSYAKVCFEYFDDLVDMWITLNEPWCSSILGYLSGEHAPGIQSVEKAIISSHHLLLAHGVVMNYYKNELKGTKPIGITLNLTPIYAKTSSYQDLIAVNNHDGFTNRWFLDPIFNGNYPMDMINLYSQFIADFSFIREGDLTLISIPNDFLGINYYSRQLVEFNAESDFLFQAADSNYPKTAMGWDVSINEFKDLICRIRKDYTHLPILITENGAAYNDKLEVNGLVHDIERTNYINAHIDMVERLNEEGYNIKGYYLWSFLDNFEWAYGYEKRFGMVYVDFKTQQRYLKDSAKSYHQRIKSRKKNQNLQEGEDELD